MGWSGPAAAPALHLHGRWGWGGMCRHLSGRGTPGPAVSPGELLSFAALASRPPAMATGNMSRPMRRTSTSAKWSAMPASPLAGPPVASQTRLQPAGRFCQIIHAALRTCLHHDARPWHCGMCAAVRGNIGACKLSLIASSIGCCMLGGGPWSFVWHDGGCHRGIMHAGGPCDDYTANCKFLPVGQAQRVLNRMMSNCDGTSFDNNDIHIYLPLH